jgi:hypothetical protein
MARKASPVGPHIHSLIEDARVDLVRAVLAVREGDNEPDFGLPTAIPDPSDEEMAHGFRQNLLQILSKFDADE